MKQLTTPTKSIGVTTSQAQEFEIVNTIAWTLKLTKAFDEKVAHIKNYYQSVLLRSQRVSSRFTQHLKNTCITKYVNMGFKDRSREEAAYTK